jgi:prepilin-type N-terminal cleavage/methylation domain-containing protein
MGAGLSKLQERNGFSITEILISIVIIAVGVIGLASAVSFAATELWYGDRDTHLSMLITDQMERLKAAGYDAVTPGQRSEAGYVLEWIVEGSAPKKVILTAGYRSRDGQARADTIVTYLTP